MKTLYFVSLFFWGIASGIFAQKVEFSGYLASGGGVHTSTPSVIDKNGNIFVAGGTREGLKVTNDAFQKKYDNSAPPDSSQSWMSGDITITVLSLNLNKILFSTYLGGKSLDYIRSFSFGSDGKLFLAGGTYSDNYPVTNNAYKKTMAGEREGFLTILNNKLSAIEYFTYIGGDSTDQVNSIYIEDTDNIILAGETKSPDFPSTIKYAEPDSTWTNCIWKFDLTDQSLYGR
jgi:hypothetical protein